MAKLELRLFMYLNVLEAFQTILKLVYSYLQVSEIDKKRI